MKTDYRWLSFTVKRTGWQDALWQDVLLNKCEKWWLHPTGSGIITFNIAGNNVSQ